MHLKKTNVKTANSIKTLLAIIVLTLAFTALNNEKSMAQQKEQMVRLAKIKVDPAQLTEYNAALKTQMKTAVKLEPGVITYYAVADKKDPTSITILEIYADTAAYQAHIKTTHFLHYKKTVENMVKSLELVDVNIIGSAVKPEK